MRVLSADPKKFTGRIKSTVGDWVSGQETTTDMARKAGALYAMNGGFFTISPADGTPGVPAGLSVVDGTVLTAATNGRYALALDNDGRKTRVAQLSSHYTIRFGAATHPVDALNRVPGLVRNCGGIGGDIPTQRPVHDFTCTDPDELVVLTPEYGTTPAAGPGVEAFIDQGGTVSALRPRTGAAVPPGYRLVQAIGADASWLSAHEVDDADLVEVEPDRPAQVCEGVTGLFCFNDRAAVGACRGLVRRGLLVPRDVSVVGFDDQEFIADHADPPLTTVALPHYAMGEWAARVLVDRINGAPEMPENGTAEEIQASGLVGTSPEHAM
jgi:hypothetical protein